MMSGLPRLLFVLALMAIMLPGAGHTATAAFQEATPAAGCPTTSPAENEAIAARWFNEAMTSGDPAVFDEILADPMGIDGAAIPENPPPAVLAEVLLTAFPDLAFSLDLVISSDDKVVVRWTATGTNTGPFLGNAPTGNSATWTGITIFQLECGRIVNVWAELDGVDRLRQLGLLPAAAGTGGTAAGGGTPRAGEPATACAPTAGAEHVALVTRWYDEVISGHDAAVLDEILADEVAHDSGAFPSEPGPRVIIGAMLTGFPDVDQNMDDVIASGEYVVVRWTATGTNTGEFQGNPATGQAATWTGINIFRIECGRITGVITELDALGRMEQLGLLPGAGASAEATPAG